jgi:hypothetical protein
MLNVKGIAKVFKKWKTAKACTLHVFPPTMNEQFSMNKFACAFGKVELVFFLILKVKGITKVFEEWKSAEACILNVFCCADCD